MKSLLLAAALIMAGCGSMRSAPPPPAPPAPPAETELAEALEQLERLVEQCTIR